MRHSGAILLLVEENATLRDTLRHYLGQRFRVKMVEAVSADDAVAMARRCRPDVILLDLSLPEGAGTNVIPLIHASQPTARIIAMASYPDHHYSDAAVSLGAWSCISKDALGSQLEPSLRCALGSSRAAGLLRPDAWWAWIDRRIRWLDENGPWAGKPRIRILYAANVVSLAMVILEKHATFGL